MALLNKSECQMPSRMPSHEDVIKRKHFPHYWPFVRGIHRSSVNSPHRGQWHGASMFSLIRAWTRGWVNNRDTGDLRRHRAHYDVTVMLVLLLNMLTWHARIIRPIQPYSSKLTHWYCDDSVIVQTRPGAHFTKSLWVHKCNTCII